MYFIFCFNNIIIFVYILELSTKEKELEKAKHEVEEKLKGQY